MEHESRRPLSVWQRCGVVEPERSVVTNGHEQFTEENEVVRRGLNSPRTELLEVSRVPGGTVHF